MAVIPPSATPEAGQEFSCRRGCLRGRSPSESRPNRCSAANRECVPQPDSCSAAAVYSITAATGCISLRLTATPLQVAKDGPTVRLLSRSGYNLSKLIPCRSVVLDAELYLCAEMRRELFGEPITIAVE